MCFEREIEGLGVREKGKEMALEAVVYPNDHFCKDFFSSGGGGWNYDFGLKQEEEDEHLGFVGLLEKMDNHSLADDYVFPPPLPPPLYLDENGHDYQTTTTTTTNSSEPLLSNTITTTTSIPAASTTIARRKRRRTKINKNKEEVENQRMTHIVVERNRRKQMNDYLAVLRSLMPASYVQRVCTM